MQKIDFSNVSNRKKLYIIGGIVLAVLIIIVIVILAFGKGKAPSEQGNDDSAIKLETNAVLPVNQLIDR